MSNWITSHKTAFLYIAIALMCVGFASALREKRKKGKNANLVFVAVASLITVVILLYPILS